MERTSSNNLNLENSNAASTDRKHRRWFQDALPLGTAVAADSKSKQDVLNKGSEKSLKSHWMRLNNHPVQLKYPTLDLIFSTMNVAVLGKVVEASTAASMGGLIRRTDLVMEQEKLVALKLPSQLIVFPGGSKPKVAAIVGCCDCRWRRS